MVRFLAARWHYWLVPYNPSDPFAPLDEPTRRDAVTLTLDGDIADPATLTREELERQAPEIARLLAQCALGQVTMTYQQIQAAKLVMDKLVASAVQRVDIRATVEVRDKREAIDAMVEALLRPGAVGKASDGKPVLNLPATVTEARLAREDGRGPPQVDATGMPVGDDLSASTS
jgi:hypothetical protein